jgi:phosphatidylglycerophosphate synthase
LTYTSGQDWQTKPSDRFILKWIKLNLSSRVTGRVVRLYWLRPWMVTVSSAALGTLAGLVFGLGIGWLAGLMAALAQILDGVDGQMARLNNTASPEGAFLDSVLDRYPDGAMMIGMLVYLIRLPEVWAPAWVLLLGAAALIGGNLVSYASARADSLGLDLGPPTLASKGTRTTVMVLGALGSLVYPPLPLASLVYLAVHPNIVLAVRIYRVFKGRP